MRVLVCYPIEPEESLLDILRTAAPSLDVRHHGFEEPWDVRRRRNLGLAAPSVVPPALRAELAAAEVVMALELPDRIAELAPGLRWVQSVGSGVDQFRTVGLPSEVIVTNGAGVQSASIAEFVIARVLAVWKRLAEMDTMQREQRWESIYGRLLSGSTLVVVGLGAIGEAVAERAHALGMHVVGVRRRPRPSPHCEKVVGPADLHQVLGRADVVLASAPATVETAGMFDAAVFAAMRPGAVFCNVARGRLVDEDALLDALHGGHLGAAILDVTRIEPLPAGSPLWTCPNLFLSPHSASVPDNEGPFHLFADNLGRWSRGEPLRNLVESDIRA
jgi:phosphoglycerate dehydrogenase-like enzyme